MFIQWHFLICFCTPSLKAGDLKVALEWNVSLWNVFHSCYYVKPSGTGQSSVNLKIISSAMDGKKFSRVSSGTEEIT